jgi:hypothetical protein
MTSHAKPTRTTIYSKIGIAAVVAGVIAIAVAVWVGTNHGSKNHARLTPAAAVQPALTLSASTTQPVSTTSSAAPPTATTPAAAVPPTSARY